MKKRIVFYDVLRVIAIFAVIMIHVSAENWYVTKIDNNWLMNNFMNTLVGVWAVPLFVTISGALLLGNKKINFKNLIKKYIPRILICLFFWHLVYYFYTTPEFTISNLVICLKKFLIGDSYSHLWYLYLTIGLYLLTPVLNKLVENLEKKEFIYLLVLGFFITSIIPTLNYFLDFDLLRFIYPFKVLNFNIFIFYYLLGYYLNKFGFKKNKLLLIISLILLFGLAIFETILSIIKNTPISYCSTSNIIGLLIVISVFSYFKETFENKENKFITTLGSLTFGVYLMHFLIEKILLNFGINSNMMNPILGNIVISFVILFISYIISYIISKIPILRKLIL